MGKALRNPFFLSLIVPLPRSILKAAEFSRDSNPELVALFWDAQLRRLDGLLLGSQWISEAWIKLIPDYTAPAAGALQLPAIMALAAQCGLGGTVWLQQFLFGFPLVGRLSQPRRYQTKLKENLKRDGPISKALKKTASCFADRAKNYGRKNAKALWNEALEQCEKGWMGRPFPLCAKQGSCAHSNPKLNIAFRLGVDQGEKLRACGDLRYSRTNLSCVVETPIKLVRWGRLSELSNVVNNQAKDWSFFKADHEAAYKKLPLGYFHAKLAVAALRSPGDNQRYGFISRTMMFGAVAAVLHYNVFSRLLSELVSQLLGIPLLCFFDDFGSITQAELGEKALATFTSFCSKLGIRLKPAKSEWGHRITFLGREGSFPCKANNCKLSVSLTDEKARKWADEVSGYGRNRSISSPELEKLIGKLSFSQANLFGKFARTQLPPLYKKFYSRDPPPLAFPTGA